VCASDLSDHRAYTKTLIALLSFPPFRRKTRLYLFPKSEIGRTHVVVLVSAILNRNHMAVLFGRRLAAYKMSSFLSSLSTLRSASTSKTPNLTKYVRCVFRKSNYDDVHESTLFSVSAHEMCIKVQLLRNACFLSHKH
jgi:hypothetical protein